MKYEKVSKMSLVMWEILLAAAGVVLELLIIEIFVPCTWLWYLLLWFVGAVYVLAATLYFPLLYLSIEYAVFKNVVLYRHGVFFPKSEFLYRNRIAYVTILNNPLTPILHISTLHISGAGGNLHIPFLKTKRATELSKMLIRHKEEQEK